MEELHQTRPHHTAWSKCTEMAFVAQGYPARPGPKPAAVKQLLDQADALEEDAESIRWEAAERAATPPRA